ncbi:H+/Cl-antiporter ClcA [Fibrobacter sp. UWT2]|nr:chloride channel protein [Fibrobacter sp. UWT2]SHK97075.1 H+/Cl-antiporter ClcA [Fibrobacter sp. UWT2]
MNFRDFGKYNQFKEQFAGMSPEMKEQMMRMAKEQMKMRIQAFIQKWLSQPILIAVALVLGAIVGALTAFFGQVLLAVSALRDANPLYWIPGLALIGVAIVLGYQKFGKGSERGMDMVFGVAHGKESEIPLRMIPMVAVSTWLTHLFGGSAGREGVAIQIGATLGHNISKKIHVENAGKILLIAGMAAGFAGLFQTPLAAIALALEVLLVGYLNLSALLPATVAAFTAYKVSEMLGLEKFSVDLNTLFPDWNVAGLLWNENGLNIQFVLKLALLGILFGIVGGGFAKLLSLAKKLFANKLPNPLKRIAFVGIAISLLLLLFWQGRYAGLGTNLIDMSFAGSAQDATSIYACDWILKFALTIVTIAVGFKGGEVTPLFAIGATFGTWVAAMVGVPLPLAAALGYAAVFGGATNTLFAPIFIGAEIFGFDTLPAFFIVCVLAFACNGGQSIYAQKKLRLK